MPRRKSAILRFMREQPLGTFGLAIITVYVVCAILAPWLAPYDPVANDLEAQTRPPSGQHWFGTDQYGRDILSRIMHGARTALAVGLISSIVGCSVGALIGAASGYLGGRFDLVIQRLVDVLMSFPIIVLAVVVGAVFPKEIAIPGFWIIPSIDLSTIAGVSVSLIAAIALPMVPRMARVARSSTLSLVQMPFIDAARTAGFGSTRIVLRHIAPNIAAPYLIMVTAFIAQAILSEASLSFLGLGVTEPTPAWGLMLSGEAANFYEQAPWMIYFPGLAITLSVFAFNLFGDSLRDWLDPKLKV
ncbi:MAG: ABC transporter permease [Hyphomicrobiaceae bacterium]|nr:MAG: ABC transporter permease [Hyphomicrobiaceae bacterium]